MRVLLVGDYPPPQGGVAVHVQQLHGFLRERGADVKVLDIGKGGRPAPDVLPVRGAPALARALLREQPGGVVHLHTSGNNPKAWAVVAAVGALRLSSGPRFVTLHSGLLPAFLAASPARRAAARAALLPYTGVVAVSEAVAAAVRGLGVPPARLHVHPAFLASQVRPAATPPAPLLAARARRRLLLAYAHHPSKVYGRRPLFEALALLAARFEGVGLAVFGPGTRAPEFLQDAREAGVEGLLEDLGELPHGEALAVVAAADAFVRPTLADGDAISVREALTLGRPCVASDAALRPAGVVTYPTGSAAGLADAVERALLSGAPAPAGPDAGPFLLSQYAAALARTPAARRTPFSKSPFAKNPQHLEVASHAPE
jgi:glycosyltransferase involved in cell wall biosynthesis